ncbi:MAG: hypothetical protein HOH77_10840 [Candidatus Latescibacteria bacterium]|jgi:hypothetical protein|nr:hypothetical protein [Candidatus Latescibacterota bacterium]
MSTSISGNLRFLIPNLMTLMVSLGGLAAMGIAYYQHTRMATSGKQTMHWPMRFLIK